jgi:hypothetical protein
MRWIEGLKSTKRQGDGVLRPGMKSLDLMESFGHTVEVTAEVVRVEEGRSVELRLSSKVFDGGARYLIEPREAGVTLRAEGEARFKGVYKLAGAMMAPMMQKKLEQDLERLKSLAEAEESGRG